MCELLFPPLFSKVLKLSCYFYNLKTAFKNLEKNKSNDNIYKEIKIIVKTYNDSNSSPTYCTKPTMHCFMKSQQPLHEMGTVFVDILQSSSSLRSREIK